MYESAINATPEAYVKLFESRTKPQSSLSGVCGRVMRGSKPEDFTRLSFMPGRPAWALGPEGLEAIIGLSGTEIVLNGIGKVDRSWLDNMLADGMRWKLAVFSEAVAHPADWDGLFAMVESMYPAKVAAKLQRWRREIEDKRLFDQFDPAAKTSDAKSRTDDSNHMSVARFLASDDTAANARLFLWHSLGVNQHYVGDGLVVSPDGSGRRVREYLVPNVPLSDLPGCRLIDLHVE